jgi:hypothetical protein
MLHIRALVSLCLVTCGTLACSAAVAQGRSATSDEELRYWLTNMVQHRYAPEEMGEALDLKPEDVRAALQRLKIDPAAPSLTPPAGELLMLPYPGGRHPRIGFLDGAVNPQRETKLSVFTPWDAQSYVVVDLPEALWSNLGLTYLAHTHVPTVWSKQGVELKPLEWTRGKDGSLSLARTLPNGIRYAASAKPVDGAIRMELSLTNGSDAKLSDLRVQNCVMLKGAAGFEQQDNDNKVLRAPFAAARDKSGERWIISAWQHCHRAWANAPCPCLHSDPKFPDCASGETQHLVGWLWFYEGKDVEAKLKELAEQDLWK